jgi:Rrf2 family protein
MAESESAQLQRLTEKEYGYGFVTDIETDSVPPGLSEDVVRLISAKKNEPQWLLDFRLKALAREGLLASQRGSKGGYALARHPEQITVPEMITALEGPISLTECTLHPGACQQESNCGVREPWQRINDAVHDALDRITLADLAASRTSGSLVALSSLGVRLDAARME